MADFNVGDIVIKLYGKHPAKIERLVTWNNKFYCKYLHSNGAFEARACDLKLYDLPYEEVMAETKTLYSFKKTDGTVAYGHHIGTNSNNNYLIEEKGTGEIHVMKLDEIEEVLPYTFSASINGKETHYVCQPDTVKKGDFLLYTQGSQPMIALVTAVDTKNKSARSKFRGKRMLLEDL